MANKDKTQTPADTLPEQSGKETNVSRPSESYYKEMAQHHAGFNTNYLTPSDSLETLHHRTCRLNRLFLALNRPWVSASWEIQKACAYYLLHAELPKESFDTFIRLMGEIGHSVCHLAACSDFIAQMQRYYCQQEKEIRHLLDERKQIESRHKESAEQLSAEGAAYCMTVGEGEIYGITYPQIEELYRIMGLFIEREKAPFECNSRSYDEYGISISKNVYLCADKDDHFFIDYSLSTFDGQLQCMSAEQLLRISDTILGFLRTYGENGEKKVHWDIADYPRESQPDVAFEIKEDNRLPEFRTAPWISKSIHKDEDGEAEMKYFVDVNEIHSTALSFGEFVAIYRKLGDFLNSCP